MIVHRNVVLVVGPPLAGVSSVIAALRDRLPEHSVLEANELATGEAPAAVVFVVSATAQLTESDGALLDDAAADTDAVIAVVSKIDVHRTWRAVLDADRALLVQRSARYRDVPWVGVAAAPDLGTPVIDELVATLRAALGDDELCQRNRLRALENRLLTLSARLDGDVEDAAPEARLGVLREERAAAVRRFRLDKTERAIAVRSEIQQARIQLSHFARTRCAQARTELQQDATAITRRRLGRFADDVRRQSSEVSDDIQERAERHLADLGERLGLTVEPPTPSSPAIEVGAAPLGSRGAETRLSMLLGAGFGLGVALTVSRLFADVAPRWVIGGAIVGAAIGLAVTLWVIGVRGLLQDRAVLDRWVVDVSAGLRTAMEQWIATRVLAAEAALARAAAERDAIAGAQTDDEVTRIDRQLREYGVRRARAATIRNRQVPLIESELVAVRTDLDELSKKRPQLWPSESFL